MTWLAHLLLPRGILSDLQRDMALILTSQAEIITRLRELRIALDRLDKDIAPDSDAT